MRNQYDAYIDVYQPGRWHIPNDTEAAFVALPGHECCPSTGSGDECVCVTTADVEYWNQVSAITALSGIDFDSLSSVTSLSASASLWNSTYVTVLRNSATWADCSAIEGFKDLSGMWQSASSAVSANSAIWNNAGACSGISANRKDIEKLSADFAKTVKIYFSPDSITGTGTINQPYGVRNYDSIISTLNIVNNGYNLLFPQGKQGWVSLTAESDIDGINPYQKALFSAVAVKDTDQDKALIKHSELIEWLIENLNGARNEINILEQKSVEWVNIPAPTSESDARRYYKNQTVYFSV